MLLLAYGLVYGQTAAPPATPAEKPKAETSGPPAASAEKKDSPAKSKLEEMLQKALQDNPDLRLAAAKVAEADAELNRARLLVVQKVGAAYQAIEAQKAAVESAGAELNELKTVARSGAASNADLRTAEQKLLDAKAKLAALETEMPYLLGKQPVNNTSPPTNPPTGAGGLPGMGQNSGLGALGGSSLQGGGFSGGFSGSGLGQLGGGFVLWEASAH